MSKILPFVEDTQPLVGEHEKSATPSMTSILNENISSQNPSAAETKENTPNNNNGGNNRKEGVTSLSFDQVNDNADELIELRGEGRYFGVTDPSSGTTINSLQSMGPLCANCHKRGHIRAKCKTVVCHKCGVVGDHYETQCPTTMICSRCGLKGHVAIKCKNKLKKRQYCKHCDTFNHGDDMCPSIWRSYLTLPTPKSDDENDKYESTVLPVVYCYNCGDDEHYGDECPEPRTSRIPCVNGSAFSGTNLPRHLRSLYFDRINSTKLNTQKKLQNAKPTYTNNYASSSNNSNYGNKGSYNNGSYRNNFTNYNDYNYNSNSNFNRQPIDNNFNGYYNNNNNNNNINSHIHFKPNSRHPAKSDKPNPSRSGVIPSSNSKKNNKKPTRSGFIDKNKNKVSKPNSLHKPTRSGLIESSGNRAKKQGVKNIKNLY